MTSSHRSTSDLPMTDKELDEVWSLARLYPDGLNFGGHTVMRLLATIAALKAYAEFEHLESYRRLYEQHEVQDR